jgi:hypothetical protein
MVWVYSMTIYRMTRAVVGKEVWIDRFEMKISLQDTEMWSAYGESEVDCGRESTIEPLIYVNR